ncbi:unnamed protein product [Boreogadus saida]
MATPPLAVAVAKALVVVKGAVCAPTGQQAWALPRGLSLFDTQCYQDSRLRLGAESPSPVRAFILRRLS